jgi:hypothetical protein
LNDALGHNAFFANVAGGGHKDAQHVWRHAGLLQSKESLTGGLIISSAEVDAKEKADT